VEQIEHTYEVRPRKDKRGVDLISDALPFGRLWYEEPNAATNAIGYAMHSSRSHHATGLLVCIWSFAAPALQTECSGWPCALLHRGSQFPFHCRPGRTVVLLDHWREWQFVFWKAGMLVAMIFAFYCYERQFVGLGETVLRPPSWLGTAIIGSTSTPEQTMTRTPLSHMTLI